MTGMLHSLLKLLSCFFGSIILFGMFFGCDAWGKENMEIKKDESKTTYTIGSSQDGKDGKTEEERDKENAWDMLKNMNIIIDKRGEGGQKNGR